ncbi:glycosyltransferase family 2 protein [Acidobacteria bacterium ACD]|nr:MAG: glycosyltransferase family 2 protein [Acidobacteriota bacterium]MCE7956329.1 glycosyltransferase family 2 protein [Acidobacteria bacterium ACB2]MDL1948433.1 glycosyltransferase family 2 protein [Acidobacteria bacterium ACD]
MENVVPDLVSTVIPVFNRAALLAQAVGCVLAQTYRPIEIVVVDDGSTDDTREAAEALAARHPGVLRVLTRPNGGPGLARETGRAAARGEYIQYLDSDDWLDPRKFEVQVSALRDRPGADVAYCKSREYVIGGDRCDVPAARTGVELETLFPHLLSGRVWHTMTPVYRRTLTDRVGPWTSLRQEEDWEYDARAGALGARLAWCPEFLADARHHGGDRASGSWERDPVRMAWRCESHELIFRHAEAAGVSSEDPHMRQYARELFHLCRLAGDAGLEGQAARMLELAVAASAGRESGSRDMRAYRSMARLLGWSRVGRAACAFDRVRSGLGPPGGDP